MRNIEHDMRNAICEMRNIERDMRNAICEMRNIERDTRNAICEMRNIERDMRNAICEMRWAKCDTRMSPRGLHTKPNNFPRKLNFSETRLAKQLLCRTERPLFRSVPSPQKKGGE